MSSTVKQSIVGVFRYISKKFGGIAVLSLSLALVGCATYRPNDLKVIWESKQEHKKTSQSGGFWAHLSPDIKTYREAYASVLSAQNLNLNGQMIIVPFSQELLRAGKEKEAIGGFIAAIEEGGFLTPYAYQGIGITLKIQGKLNQAVLAYEMAIKANPDEPQFYIDLREVLRKQRKTQKAEKVYRRAAKAYFNLGRTYLIGQEYEEAETNNRKATEINSSFAPAYTNLGVALSFQGKYEEAIEAYTRAIALSPKSDIAHNNLGITFAHLGRKEEAIKAILKANEYDSDFEGYQENLRKVKNLKR